MNPVTQSIQEYIKSLQPKKVIKKPAIKKPTPKPKKKK